MHFSFAIVGFLGWGFLGLVQRPYVQLSSRADRRIKGWLRRNGWVTGWLYGWAEEWVDRWAEGEGKGGVRV
jgi:hypothetical protein